MFAETLPVLTACYEGMDLRTTLSLLTAIASALLPGLRKRGMDAELGGASKLSTGGKYKGSGKA